MAFYTLKDGLLEAKTRHVAKQELAKLFTEGKKEAPWHFTAARSFFVYKKTTKLILPKTFTKKSLLYFNYIAYYMLQITYLGRLNAFVISAIWPSLMPSGSSPMFFDAMYIRALLLSTST